MKLPIVAELIPNRLQVAVFVHEVTVGGVTVPCRTVHSHGLVARHGREVVVTRVAPPDEGVVRGDEEVFAYLARLYEAEARSGLLALGAITTFDAAFLGAATPNAVTYVEAESFVDVPVDDGALAAVVLHADEAAVAEKYGAARVLARLGRQAAYHPYPRWWDPSRASVAHPDDDAASTLARVFRVSLLGATLTAIDRTVVLKIPRDARDGLAGVLRSLAPDAPVALLAPPAALTDAALVWAPGQRAIAATSSNGRRDRVGGAFVLFSPGHDADHGILHEDGFAMLLRDETWRALCAALRTGRGALLDSGDEANHGLRVEWVRDPDEAATPDDEGPVRLARVVFMTPEQVVAREVPARELSRYLAALRDAVVDHLASGAEGPGCDLLLQFELTPRQRPMVNLAVRPLPPPRSCDGLLARLERIPAPAVRGHVAFRLMYAVHGGSGQPLD